MKKTTSRIENGKTLYYIIPCLFWVFLGIFTGLVSKYHICRIVFVCVSCFLAKIGWDCLNYKIKKIPDTDEEMYWNKMHLKMVCCCGPLFFVWIASLIHQILWWQTDFMNMDKRQNILGWTQSTVVIFCSLLSLFDTVIKNEKRRTILKSIMIIFAFLLPPWREPWYEETVWVLQLRWIIMAFLFLLQWFEGYNMCNRKEKCLVDVYLLRICWIPLVKPILMVISIVFVFSYIIMIHSIFSDLMNKNDPKIENYMDTRKTTTHFPYDSFSPIMRIENYEIYDENVLDHKHLKYSENSFNVKDQHEETNNTDVFIQKSKKSHISRDIYDILLTEDFDV